VDLNGIILIDKREGYTSFEVTQRVKRNIHAVKAGHTGTLDKFASGLLIVCLNNATAYQQIFMKNSKTYRAVFHFGIETDTLDPYGIVIRKNSKNSFRTEEINEIVEQFTGKIQQIPPLYSALKRNGEPLYKKARKGKFVEIEPREVEIERLLLLENKGERITIEATVSKGTYIRALARDIAHALGSCGFCEELRRTSIGPFSITQANRVEEINMSQIISITNALSFLPAVQIPLQNVNLLINRIPLMQVFDNNEMQQYRNEYIRVLAENKLVAVIRKNYDLHYFKVLRNS